MHAPPSQCERRCPECFYDLQGLKEPCECPECGRAIDRGARLWRPAQPFNVLFSSWLGLFVLGTCFFANILGTAAQFIHPDYGLVLFLISVVIVSAAWVYRRYRLGLFVYLDNQGIHYRLQANKVQFIRWSKVSKIVPYRYDRAACVILEDRMPRDGKLINKALKNEVTFQIFRSSADVMTFIETAECLRTESLSHSKEHPLTQ